MIQKNIRIFFYLLIENVDEQFRDCTEYDELHEAISFLPRCYFKEMKSGRVSFEFFVSLNITF